MTFRHLTLLAIAVLVLVLGAGFLANQRWVVRNLQYKAAEAERKRQSDPLLLFGSSLTEVALEVPRTVRGTVYVPAYQPVDEVLNWPSTHNMPRPKLRTTTLCSGLIAEQRLR